MNLAKLKAGMPVDCRDQQLGTLLSVSGSGSATRLQVQATRPDGTTEPLEFAASDVASVSKGRVRLNVDCAGAVAAAEPLRLALAEEQLVVTPEWREAGALEVSKSVRTSVQELDVPLRYEEAVVERVALNRLLADDETPQPRREGDFYVVPVIHEEIVVTKRRVLVEELRITTQTHTRTQHVAEEVRREEVSINHEGLRAHPSGD